MSSTYSDNLTNNEDKNAAAPEITGYCKDENDEYGDDGMGRLERLKAREAELSLMLRTIRREKMSALRSKPLAIGIVGFGRFGQFIARTFARREHRVVVTSRSDYTDIAENMGVKYIPLSDTDAFLAERLDAIVLAVSIVSFEGTVRRLAPFLQKHIRSTDDRGPLVVDVLSVKEHPRRVLLDLLPVKCDVLCTHPMFGPDSGKKGWRGLNFVYERTRINGVLLDPTSNPDPAPARESVHKRGKSSSRVNLFVDIEDERHSVHGNSEAHVEGVDRMERFLSIWEEEGCRMVPLSCREHDEYAANSQFITHLMGRILGEQGLSRTPIDTKGFEKVLRLIGTTTADSFDLFYGLYKYNQNSMDTILRLRSAMDDVVRNLKEMEERDTEAPEWLQNRRSNVASDWFAMLSYKAEEKIPSQPLMLKVGHQDDEKKVDEAAEFMLLR